MAAFPAIGQLLLNQYRERPRSVVERTAFEEGPPAQRQVATRRLIVRDVVYAFSGAEHEAFEAFFTGDIAHGADWFAWDDPKDGATKQARIVGGDYDAQPHAESPGGEAGWRVRMQLETWE